MPRFIFRRWPVKATIFEKRGNRTNIVRDKARRFEDVRTGDTFYRLKKKRVNSMPIPYDNIYSVGKINQTFLHSPAPGIFFPRKLTEDQEAAFNRGNIADVEQSIAEQIQNESEEIQKPQADGKDVLKSLKDLVVWRDWFGFRLYKNYAMTDPRTDLAKIMPMVGIMMVIIFVALAMFILFRGMEGMVDRAAGAEERWNKMNERFMDQNDKLLRLVDTGKVPASEIIPPPGV